MKKGNGDFVGIRPSADDPVGLEVCARREIELRGADDWKALPGSPIVIEAEGREAPAWRPKRSSASGSS